ncbi:MAG: N-acetyl-gamma-glutamyl-phosphate reductase [Planctomycetota bacterium]|nr:N-acetyl-gamma-glutamyl-phosphate reductase [Planctomycetota bacterium]
MTRVTQPTIPVAVVGAAGYAGAELCERLLNHPSATISGLFGSRGRTGDGSSFSTLFPRFLGILDTPIVAGTADAIIATGAKAVFLCTPHEASAELVPTLLDGGLTVFDLSAAFRLRDASQYESHYGFVHPSPELLTRSVYGMADLFANEISTANLIAVPGCYPTSAILPILPLQEAGLIRRDAPVIIDSTSGVSGAGRTATTKSLFCEVSQQAYGVLNHRHEPEIAQWSRTDVVFTPHLGPFDRGILSTIHLPLADGVTDETLRAVWADRFAGSAFVRILPSGTWSSVGAVRGTNMCHISLATSEHRKHAVVTSAIDNLVKGAVGQALHCFNIRFSIAPETGLGLFASHSSARIPQQLVNA